MEKEPPIKGMHTLKGMYTLKGLNTLQAYARTAPKRRDSHLDARALLERIVHAIHGPDLGTEGHRRIRNMTSHLDPELGHGDRSAGLNAEKLMERLRPGAVSRLNSANSSTSQLFKTSAGALPGDVAVR
jgi:hypothetical protein